jgi:Tol biopolymer transport system component
MNTFKTCVKISLIVMLLLTASEPARAQPEVNIERVSEAPGGLQSNNESGSPAISSNGRYVAFKSYASNLVPNDTNRDADIFVHDQQTGTIERVSVASDGTQANGESVEPAISADGRFVAFKSAASNLVSGDTNGYSDIFIHDRQTGITERVSVTYTGTQANLFSYDAAVSNDGRYVAFTSSASNLVPGDTNGVEDVFIHDRQTDETERVSIASDGTQANGRSYSAAISDDGRYLTFPSNASNLVPNDTNEKRDIFLHDRQTGTTERISIAADYSQANYGSYSAAISAEGRFVVFSSEASNLVPGDTNGYGDIFIRDRWMSYFLFLPLTAK